MPPVAMLAGPLADASGRRGQTRRQATVHASVYADAQPVNGQAPVKALPTPTLRALPGGVACCSRARAFRPPGCRALAASWIPSSGRGNLLGLTMLPLAACSAALAFSARVSPYTWRSPSRSPTAFGRAGMCHGLPALRLSTATVSLREGVCQHEVRHPQKRCAALGSHPGQRFRLGGSSSVAWRTSGMGNKLQAPRHLTPWHDNRGLGGRPSRHLRPGYAEHLGVRRKRAAAAAPLLREAGRHRGARPAPGISRCYLLTLASWNCTLWPRAVPVRSDDFARPVPLASRSARVGAQRCARAVRAASRQASGLPSWSRGGAVGGGRRANKHAQAALARSACVAMSLAQVGILQLSLRLRSGRLAILPSWFFACRLRISPVPQRGLEAGAAWWALGRPARSHLGRMLGLTFAAWARAPVVRYLGR
jgi:hypothetical protein